MMDSPIVAKVNISDGLMRVIEDDEAWLVYIREQVGAALVAEWAQMEYEIINGVIEKGESDV
jgi:hypothetical protein